MFTDAKDFDIKKCPKCHKGKLQDWKQLSADEKFVTERLPMSADYSVKERELHAFCTNCWFETKTGSTIA